MPYVDQRHMAQYMRLKPGPIIRTDFPVTDRDKASTTDVLLKELIAEVKGLRADMKVKDWLPDTPFVRRIMAEIDNT